MAAVPLLAGVGIMMMCCSSSSIAFLVMGDEEKKVPDGNDAAGEAQVKADEAQVKAEAVAADPNSTPEEVAAAQTEADEAQTEADEAQTEADATPTPTPTPTPPTPSTVRGKAIGGYYNTFAECWADASGDWGDNGKFNCCERLGKTPYPERSDGAGYHFCYENT